MSIKNKKKVIGVSALIILAFLGYYLGTRLYKNVKTDIKTSKIKDPGEKHSTSKLPGIKGIDYKVHKMQEGLDRVENKHTGEWIYVYVTKRRYDDNRFATRGRNDPTQWKVANVKTRKRREALEMAFRETGGRGK